jgi:hypothetical protein
MLTYAGVSLRDAATRVFSNAAGSYSANVGLAIENGGWEGEQQLQEQVLYYSVSLLLLVHKERRLGGRAAAPRAGALLLSLLALRVHTYKY